MPVPTGSISNGSSYREEPLAAVSCWDFHAWKRPEVILELFLNVPEFSRTAAV